MKSKKQKIVPLVSAHADIPGWVIVAGVLLFFAILLQAIG